MKKILGTGILIFVISAMTVSALQIPLYELSKFSLYTVERVNFLREVRGLQPVQNDTGLARAATFYATVMASEGVMSHKLLSAGFKRQVITAYKPEHADIDVATVYELIGRAPRWYFSSFLALAHFFDPSPEHAREIYSQTAKYMGWGMVLGLDGYLYICVYVSDKRTASEY